jgi:hypothetical protein
MAAEEHHHGAHRSAAERTEDEERGIARAEHGAADKRSDDEPIEREDEPEQPIAGGPGDDAAEDQKRDRW